MLERLLGNQYYCFLNGFSGNFQIPIDPKDQEKTTFTYLYGTFAYRRMPFGLCNAPCTFQRFIKDFSKIARPMTRLLEKDTPFLFSKECVESFQTFKRKLTEAPILIAPDWDMPFELMCDASDFAIEQYDWLADTDEEVDEHELEALEAHYSYMAKIQEQSESVSNTCLVETDDSNVTPNSPDMCEDAIQNDQNDVESDDERVALANLNANLKLDVDENKKIQKQLKKASTTLA
nr:hypothetical protein [Tanacetum cinerariifolium]